MEISSNYFIIINIVVILFVLLFVIKGYKNGFLYELLNLLCLALSLIGAWFLSPILANNFVLFNIDNADNPLLSILPIEHTLNEIIWFAICAIILFIILSLIKKTFKKVSKLPVVGFINKLLGSIIGFFNAILLISILSLTLNAPSIKNSKEIIDNTLLKYTNSISNYIQNAIVNKIDFDSLKDKIDDIDADKLRNEFVEWIEQQRDKYE